METIKDIILLIIIVILSVIIIPLIMHFGFYVLFNDEYKEFIEDFLNKKKK